MKQLNDSQQDLMYLKRRRYKLSIDDLASILNSQGNHMLEAQMGRPIPEETYKALVGWLEPH